MSLTSTKTIVTRCVYIGVALFRGNFKTRVESERNLRGLEAWWDDPLAGKRAQMTMAMAFKVRPKNIFTSML